LSFDPREEICSFDDLRKLPPFEDDWLRGGPVRRWLPRGLHGKPIYIFETGGSTGTPKSRLQVEDFRTDYEIFSKTLSDKSFPPGSDWLMLGPSGPRRLRLAVEHLAQYRGGGIAFCVDLDPRWVIKLLKRGEITEANLYKQHTIEQALTILRSHDNIRCMFTTPKLLEALADKIDLARYGITGIFCGGTELTPQFHRFAREELVPGIDFVPTYGNTLMGLATHKPFDPTDKYEIIYHAPQPRAVLEVVDPDNPEKLVEYGELGRVRLTTLTRETFIPGFLERDEAIRRPPCHAYPWDGCGNVRPFSGFATTVVEGVY
jgi:phenylacetate-coenzyme A ligase PaaK-like adenylate-forming protein